MKKKQFTFVDLFAGIGGFHVAFHEAGGTCVFASEIDKYARETYKHNFSKVSKNLFSEGYFNEDITKMDYSKIPDFDILCAGFPCQAFSVAGYREGFDDKKGRGNLFFNILRILEVKKPTLFLLENVKNLKNHDKGFTYQKICHELTKLGYGIKTKILNASKFGLHQNRERIYIVGKKNEWKDDPITEPITDKVLSGKQIDQQLNSMFSNGLINFQFPEGNFNSLIKLNKIDESLVEHKVKVLNNDVTFYDPPELLQKYFYRYNERNDWDKYIYNFKGGHFSKAVKYINSKLDHYGNRYGFEIWDDLQWSDAGYQNIYQWRRKYVRLNKNGVSPTLTANMGTGGHNVPIIVCGRTNNGSLIRKLTPEECVALQGFKRNHFERLENISDANLYKQAGNSVPVNVIREISKSILKLL